MKQSIIRTIRLKGYPRIPNGDYFGYMNFANPVRITKEKRYRVDGRVWIGSIRSNIINISIQNQ